MQYPAKVLLETWDDLQPSLIFLGSQRDKAKPKRRVRSCNAEAKCHRLYVSKNVRCSLLIKIRVRTPVSHVHVWLSRLIIDIGNAPEPQRKLYIQVGWSQAPMPSSLNSSLIDVFIRTWYLGFTSFGGPVVHFQIFHRMFVEGQNPWIDEQTVRYLTHFVAQMP